MKKISALTASVLATAALIVAPSAHAEETAPITSEQIQADTAAVEGESDTPALSFYTGAMGDMLNCGGYIGRLWCKK